MNTGSQGQRRVGILDCDQEQQVSPGLQQLQPKRQHLLWRPPLWWLRPQPQRRRS